MKKFLNNKPELQKNIETILKKLAEEKLNKKLRIKRNKIFFVESSILVVLGKELSSQYIIKNKKIKEEIEKFLDKPEVKEIKNNFEKRMYRIAELVRLAEKHFGKIQYKQPHYNQPSDLELSQEKKVEFVNKPNFQRENKYLFKEIAEKLNLQIIKRNKSIKEINIKNPLMAGIPTDMIKKIDKRKIREKIINKIHRQVIEEIILMLENSKTIKKTEKSNYLTDFLKISPKRYLKYVKFVISTDKKQKITIDLNKILEALPKNSEAKNKLNEYITKYSNKFEYKINLN